MMAWGIRWIPAQAVFLIFLFIGSLGWSGANAGNDLDPDQSLYGKVRNRIISLGKLGKDVPRRGKVIIINVHQPNKLMWKSSPDHQVKISHISNNDNICIVDIMSASLKDCLIKTLDNLKKHTRFSSTKKFRGCPEFSSIFSGVLGAIGPIEHRPGCRFDVYGNRVVDLTVISDGTVASVKGEIGELDLLIDEKKVPVSLGSRDWFAEANNAQLFLSRWGSLKPSRLLGVGPEGLVGLAKATPFRAGWDGEHIYYLQHLAARAVAKDLRRRLLVKNAGRHAMDSEDGYLKLLGWSAFPGRRWGKFIRQAPHLLFRNWKK